MFSFTILQFVKEKPLIVHQWDEDTIIERLLIELPASQRPMVEQAWNKIIKDFKKETKNV